MKRYFLIDLENVGKECTVGLESMTADDTIIILNNTAHHLTPIAAITKAIDNTKAKCKVVALENAAHNACDFYMVALLADMFYKDKSSEYFIVSHDKGFDAALDALKLMNPGAKLKRIDGFIHEFGRELMKAELESRLPNMNKQTRKIALNCLLQSKNQLKYHELLQRNMYGSLISTVYAATKDMVMPIAC